MANSPVLLDGIGNSNSNNVVAASEFANNYVPNNPEGLILDTSLWKALDDSNNNNNGSSSGNSFVQLQNVQPTTNVLPPFGQDTQEQQQGEPGFSYEINVDEVPTDSFSATFDLLGSSTDILNPAACLNQTSDASQTNALPIEEDSSYLPTSALSLSVPIPEEEQAPLPSETLHTTNINDSNNNNSNCEQQQQQPQQQQHQDLLAFAAASSDLNFSDPFTGILVEGSSSGEMLSSSNNSTNEEQQQQQQQPSQGGGGGHMADVLLSLKHAVIHPEEGQPSSWHGGAHLDMSESAYAEHHHHLTVTADAGLSSPSSFLHHRGSSFFPPTTCSSTSSFSVDPTSVNATAASAAASCNNWAIASAAGFYSFHDSDTFSCHPTLHPPPPPPPLAQFPSPTSHHPSPPSFSVVQPPSLTSPTSSYPYHPHPHQDFLYYHQRELGHQSHDDEDSVDSKEGIVAGVQHHGEGGEVEGGSLRGGFGRRSALLFDAGKVARISPIASHDDLADSSPSAAYEAGSPSALLTGEGTSSLPHVHHHLHHHHHPSSPDSSTDTTKNVCNICGKTYARPSTLKTHLRTHSGERPYRCYSCNKSFSQAANLTAHCRTHSGEKPFHCSICNRKFSQSSSVTTHMRTHSGERPYRCRMCKKAFSDSSTLTKHLRIHSGEKPYQCKLCHLRFSQSGNLNRHMRIHAQGTA